MKGILCGLASLFLSLCLHAADTTRVFIDMRSSADHELSIQINFPSGRSTDQFSYLYLPNHAPGSPAEESCGKLIRDMRAFGSDGRELLINSRMAETGTAAFETGGASVLKYIIDDSWTKSPDHLLQTGTHFMPREHFLLQFHAMLPFKAGTENGPWKLVIRKPGDMDACTAHSLFRKSSEEDILTAATYYDLIRCPVSYTQGFPVSFKSGKTTFRISVYRQGRAMSEREIIDMVKPVCEAARFFSGGLQAENHQVLLHFLDPEKSRVSSGAGAIQMGASSVICLPDHASELKRRRDLQYALAHELMHLYAPLAIPTDLTSKVNLRAQRPSENLWYYEGFTEYLSLLMLYRSRLISEDEFMAEIRNRISLSRSYEPFNLAEESRDIYIPGHAASYSNFYYKGAVVAFLLDLRLMYMSRGVMNLPALLEKVANGVPEGLVIRDERLSSELLQRSYTELKSFFERYVYGADPIPFNEFLPVIGWFYEEERRDRINLYVDALFRFDKSERKFYLLNITYDQVGFKEGDYLVKINGRRLTESNYMETMDGLGMTGGAQKAVFHILREGRRMRLEAGAVEVNRIRRDFIRIEPRPGDEMAFFRELYRSGQTLERAYQIIN